MALLLSVIQVFLFSYSISTVDTRPQKHVDSPALTIENSFPCPKMCQCTFVQEPQELNLTVCENANLTSLPLDDINLATNFLDVSGNKFNFTIGAPFFGNGPSKLSQLEALDMKKCAIQSLSEDAFSSMGILIKLDLSDNNITALHALAFADNKMLDSLNLRGNPLKTLVNFQFVTLPRLRTLDVSKTQLTAIEPEAISNLFALESLYLNENELTTLPKDIFTSLVQLKDIRLENNTWICDCPVQLLTFELQFRDIYRNWTCHYPDSNVSVVWSQMENVTTECRSKFPVSLKQFILSGFQNHQKHRGHHNEPHFLERNVRNLDYRVNIAESSHGAGISGWGIFIVGITAASGSLCIFRIVVKSKRRRMLPRFDDDYEKTVEEGMQCKVFRDYDNEQPGTSHAMERSSLLEYNEDDMDDISISTDL